MSTLPDWQGTGGHDCGAEDVAFRRIADCAVDGILVIQDGKVQYSNPAMLDLISTSEQNRGSRIRAPVHIITGDTFSGMPPVDNCPVLRARHVAGSWCGRPATIWFFPARSLTGPEERSRERVVLAGMITRHGIANQLMILRRTLRSMESIAGESASPYLRKIERAAREIHHQLEIAHAAQGIGTGDPCWHRLDDLLGPVVSHAESEGIRCSVAPGSSQIFADPLVAHVFENLLDNSIRHGAHVTRISLDCSVSESGLRIVWEDNGVGIPDNEKEQIFKEGYGKNTGLGLFLCREILAMTGIGIRETGTRGSGARFEIIVPEGKFSGEGILPRANGKHR